MKLSGKVELSTVKTGIICIGFGHVGVFDKYRSRTVWELSGTVKFKGGAQIGHGSKISVSGMLEIGDNLIVTAESTILARKEIIIGDNVLISWDCLIMDSDFHKIYNKEGEYRNKPSPIRIGDKVWIGCRCLILKGVFISDNVVIAASSIVSKSINKSFSINAGRPAELIASDTRWEM